MSTQHDLLTSGVAVRPLDRIVIGIDFTEASLAAAQWVGRHLARDGTVTLVHVIPPPPLPNVVRLHADSVPGPPGPDSRLRARVRSMSGALRGLARVVGRSGTTVEVRVGDPAVQLSAYASMVGADLLVVGANPVFRAARRPETATTNRLLQQLAGPGLIARTVQSSLKTVLVALTDDDEDSVLAAARMVAAPSGARVVALRVSEHHHARQASASGEDESRDVVATAEQVRMIVDGAREAQADVIVVGSGATATGGGDDDVACLTARAAACSVLVVPRPADQSGGGSLRHEREHRRGVRSRDVPVSSQVRRGYRTR
jgi:hypothetical protein